MQRKKIIALALLGVFLLLLGLAFRKSSKPSNALQPGPAAQSQTGNSPMLQQPPQSAAGTTRADTKVPASAQQQRFIALFMTPISFYGKVIDQYGKAVPQADVKLAANDKPFGGNPSVYTRKTDESGLFSISGIVGITLAVEVSKSGYRAIPETDNTITSSALFQYGIASDNAPSVPTQANPAIFTLYKYGQLEPLVKLGKRNFRIARDGSPLTISLDSTHQVVLRCWNTDLSRPAGQRQYDWKLEISVPNGGLISRKDDFAVEAPKDGYQPSDTIKMPASLPAEQWSDSIQRSYFIHFNDNIFARATLDMEAGGDHFVIWESFLNPKFGSRNLEFDPNKVHSH